MKDSLIKLMKNLQKERDLMNSMIRFEDKTIISATIFDPNSFINNDKPIDNLLPNFKKVKKPRRANLFVRNSIRNSVHER